MFFNAVRIVVKEEKFESCKVHHVKETGEDIVGKIDTNGRMDVWVEDVFDVWDQALLKIVWTKEQFWVIIQTGTQLRVPVCFFSSYIFRHTTGAKARKGF